MSAISPQTLKLSANKLALLTALRQQKGLATADNSSIHRRPADAPLLLSFTQERLWFLEQMEPEQPAYNMPWAFRVQGNLNVPALQQAFTTIVARHEVLRTTFATIDGRPQPIIHPADEAAIVLTEPADWEDAQQEVAQEVQRPFNLEKGPLLRIKLLRLKPTDHILLLNMHHIVADGWSMDILIQELTTLYAAFTDGQDNPLPDLPIQHSDYAWWQRHTLQGDRLEAQLDYWQQQLAGSRPVLELPHDRLRPVRQSYQGAVESVTLPSALSASLKQLSQTEGTTLFMTLLAAFKVLLYRYTQQTDILVGTPVANRDHPETETLIGPLFNTLVLRSDLSGTPTFRTYLQQVRQTALAAYAHQDTPFEKLVELLQPERALSHSLLFQVMFVLHHATGESLKLPGLQLRPVDVGTQSAKFDLTLVLLDTPQGISGGIEYNSDIFEAATIKQVAQHWQTLLKSIIANPDQSVDDLALLTTNERTALLNSWSNAQPNPPTLSCYPQLFEEQVGETPEAIALRLGDEQLTYQELNQRANQLAHQLRQLGVQPETCVGVYLERSLDAVIALLAIGKAGGAYLPLDPSYPAERIAYMLADTQAPLVLTYQHLLADLPQDRVTALALDSNWPAKQSTENPAPGATSADLAYVIYTSGSTGQPKGVLITHGALAQHCLTIRDHYELTVADKILQFASFSFDASLEQLLPPLITGSQVVMRGPEVPGAAAFCQQMMAQQLTVVNLPTAYWQQLTWAWDEVREWLEQGPLRLLIVGGEAMSPTQLQHWLEGGLAGVRLLNAYGPTETTITALTFDISKLEATIKPDRVPIGQPLPGRHAYVLDKRGQPVPVGVPGELHLGGAGVARGYLNRPGLTTEKFVPNPIVRAGHKQQKEGESSPLSAADCLYKTGDLVRYRSDGNIEFLGRRDHQVKLRGFRIELGEVEAALLAHPAVQGAIVSVDENGGGDKRLVAYLQGEEANPLTSSQLRTHLQQIVPHYMLPTLFIWLDEMPLTATGKIDRHALPAPEQASADEVIEFTTPRDALELQLVKIWEEVLQIHPISTTANFFHIGGHSLLAVQLMARIEKALGRALPLSTLFSHGTVEQLAVLLRQKADKGKPSPLVPIQPNGSKTPFFAVHPAGGTVLCYLDLAQRLGHDQPFYALEASGLSSDQVPCQDIQEMAAHYATAVRTIQPEGPYQLGGWCFGGTIAFEMAQQLQQQGQEVALLVLIDTYAPVSTAAEADDEGVDFDDATLYSLFVQGLGGHFGKQLTMTVEELQGLERPAIVDKVLGVLQAVRIMPLDATAIQLQRYLDVYLSNSEALAKYSPDLYASPVTLFRAAEEPLHQFFDETLGWARYLTRPIQIYDVPGDHGSMIFEPHVKALAEKLAHCLETAPVASTMINQNP